MINSFPLKFENHIILDQVSTWPEKVVEIIEESKIELQNYFNEVRRIDKLVGYNPNRPINKYEKIYKITVDILESELSNKKLIGFHCSRLMDNEIQDVLENGLIPLNLIHANSRIETIYEKGLLSEHFKEKLIDKKEFTTKGREGAIYFFHNSSTFKEEGGLIDFFKYWGGEAMRRYLGTIKELQRIGTPCIVIGSIERLELLRHEITALSNNMICIYLNDIYHSHAFESIIHNRVSVLDIIKYDSGIFKKLTNIDNWNEKINI